MDRIDLIIILCATIVVYNLCASIIFTIICDDIKEILRHLNVKKEKDNNDY